MTDTLFRIWGGEGRRGYQSRGDVLVNELTDGITLGAMWDELNEATDLWNEHRSALASLLTFTTTRPGEAVPQDPGSESFEEATEYGIPRAIGRPDYIKIGYSFKDFDIASRFTWRALRSMSSDQVTHAVQRVYEADNKLVNGSVLNALFNNVQRTNDHGHFVYPLWNGDMKPPTHMGQTFDGTHTHYLKTNSTVLDAEDVEQLIKHIRSHGYGTQPGSRYLWLMNPTDVELSGVTAWRAGVEYRSGAPLPKHDFIPSANAPARISAEIVQGAVPPKDYNGLDVTGSYAGALLIESYYIPVGYVAVVASGGPNSDMNPIGFREHERPQYQGLRMIPGSVQDYPLIETFWARGFGTGVRHRGAAAVCQIGNGTVYTPPTIAV